MGLPIEQAARAVALTPASSASPTTSARSNPANAPTFCSWTTTSPSSE
ncbi:hypothetical protein [Actinomadura rubrobrunea]|nr:hypothetical protein [Actinomadura rubrobrunea]